MILFLAPLPPIFVVSLALPVLVILFLWLVPALDDLGGKTLPSLEFSRLKDDKRHSPAFVF
jgi:hypothetical protein